MAELIKVSDVYYSSSASPLDIKLAPRKTYEELLSTSSVSGIPLTHRYLGMRVTVLNSGTTNIPCDFVLYGKKTNPGWKIVSPIAVNTKEDLATLPVSGVSKGLIVTVLSGTSGTAETVRLDNFDIETPASEWVWSSLSDVTKKDLENLASKEYVDNALSAVTSAIGGTYITSADTVNAIESAKTEGVASAISYTDSVIKNYATSAETASAIESAKIEGIASANTYTNTLSASTAEFSASVVSNYATSAETVSAITEATKDLASKEYVDSAITEATKELATKTEVDAKISAATDGLASETYVDNSITEAVAPLATKEEVGEAVSAVTDSFTTKLDALNSILRITGDNVQTITTEEVQVNMLNNVIENGGTVVLESGISTGSTIIID